MNEFNKQLELDCQKERLQLEVKIQWLLELDKKPVLERGISRVEIGNLIGECSVRLKEIEESLTLINQQQKWQD